MIEAQHLTKRHRNTTAVDEVSFVVQPRRVTGLMAATGRARRAAALATAAALAAATLGTFAAAPAPALAGVPAPATEGVPATVRQAMAVRPPQSPAGKQLAWILTLASKLPLSTKEIQAHFDSAFLDQVSPAELNQALEQLGPPGSAVALRGLSQVQPTSLVAVVQIGPARYLLQLGVDGAGLITTLLFRPTEDTVPTSWSQVDRQLAGIAPGTSLLAARVSPNGTCTPVHTIDAGTPRPLGSMFKLFVLGAVANAIKDHQVSWDEELTVTAAVKVGSSEALQDVAPGTKLTVEQVALKMIEVSDNTAADMLIKLVGRTAVEAQVRQWSSHASLDMPFLTVAELFTLKYHDFPAMADHYLALSPAQRAAYLTTTVDKVPASAEQPAPLPHDIGSIEWFASAQDLCHAFTGLAALQAEPGLNPISTVLSANNGGVGLSATTWPRIWFKGGSEPGVLTLGYLARDNAGGTFVVIVLTEDQAQPVQESLAAEVQGLNVVTGAFNLLRAATKG